MRISMDGASSMFGKSERICYSFTKKNPIIVFLFFFFFFFTFFYKITRKYWFRANFGLSVFVRFTRFRMSWRRYDYFWKNSFCLPVCVWKKIVANTKINQQNLMKFYIYCYSNTNWCLSTFGENCSTGSAVVSLFSEIFGMY